MIKTITRWLQDLFTKKNYISEDTYWEHIVAMYEDEQANREW